MKKVLVINTTLKTGGAANVAYSLFNEFSNTYEMHFAYGRNKKTEIPNTFYFGNRIEQLIHLFFVRFIGLEGFGTYLSTKKLISYIKKHKFNLINIHNLHGYYVNFPTLLTYLKKSKIPIIYSLHDEWPTTWLPAHSMGCEHCKNGIGKCVNSYTYPKNFLPLFTKYMLHKKKEIFQNMSNMTIVCPSIWLSDSIRKSFLNKFSIVTCPNGIDTNLFKPREKMALRDKYNLPNDKKIVTFSFSNLNDKNKGVRHIVEAASMLKKENIIFLGIGKCETSFENVMTTGYIEDQSKLSELFSIGDVFCFASKAETFLLTAANSLSCAVPVVGFYLPVIGEIVDENVGILTSHSTEDLAKNIVDLLSNSNKITEMGSAGREKIQNKFSINDFFNNYKKIYEERL